MVSSSQKSLVEISNTKDVQIQSPLLSSQDLGWESMVERRWAEYGLGDINLSEVDANLFGYDIK